MPLELDAKISLKMTAEIEGLPHGLERSYRFKVPAEIQLSLVPAPVGNPNVVASLPQQAAAAMPQIPPPGAAASAHEKLNAKATAAEPQIPPPGAAQIQPKTSPKKPQPQIPPPGAEATGNAKTTAVGAQMIPPPGAEAAAGVHKTEPQMIPPPGAEAATGAHEKLNNKVQSAVESQMKHSAGWLSMKRPRTMSMMPDVTPIMPIEPPVSTLVADPMPADSLVTQIYDSPPPESPPADSQPPVDFASFFATGTQADDN